MAKNKMTLNQIRENGWLDGYTGRKYNPNQFNFKKMGISGAQEYQYIFEYGKGYDAGKTMLQNSADIKLINNNIVYENVKSYNKKKTK